MRLHTVQYPQLHKANIWKLNGFDFTIGICMALDAQVISCSFLNIIKKMNMQTHTSAMAVLASKQIMPNLEGLFAFHNAEKPVTHLFIYHTHDEALSVKPAHRIKKMAEEFFPGIEAVLHQPKHREQSKHPEQVYNAIKQWFDSIAADNLVINATGGLKTMFAGVLGFLNSENIKIIYRDIDGAWLSLLLKEGSLQTEKLIIDPQRLNYRMQKLGIKNLVKIQSGFNDIHSTKSKNIDCVDMLQKVIEHQWDWRKVGNGKESSGAVFEHWFASLVSTFDVDDLLVGLEPYEKERAQMETDIWVLKNAQLTMFDLKLISKNQQKSSLAEQITNASAQSGQFAGINVTTILIRPGYSYQKNERKSFQQLAAKFSCQIWFQEDMSSLLFKLKGVFNQESNKYSMIHPLLIKEKQRSGFLFSDPDFLTSAVLSDTGKKNIPLAQLFSKVESKGYKWLGIKLDTEQYIFHISSQDVDKINTWMPKLQGNACFVEKIGRNQLIIKPRNERGSKYLRTHKSQFTTKSLFDF